MPSIVFVLTLTAATIYSWKSSGSFKLVLLKTTFCFSAIELLAYLAFHTFIYRWFLSPLRRLDYPKDGNFFLGNIGRLFLEQWGLQIADWEKTVSGGLYRVFIGPFEWVVPTSPEALSAVCGYGNVCQMPETIRQSAMTLIGDGLVTSLPEAHKVQRKMLNPIFREVRLMVPRFWTKSMRLRDAMRGIVSAPDHRRSEIIDVMPILVRGTFDMILSTTFQLNIENDPVKEDLLHHAWHDVTNFDKTQNIVTSVLEGVLPVFVQPKYTDWLLRWIPKNQRSIRGRKIMHDYILDQIRGAKEAQKLPQTPTQRQGSAVLLDMMLKSGMTDENSLVNQLLTMLVAGHETTSAALTWALFRLSKHPEIQAKLRAEVETATSSLTGSLTPELMDSMTYLHGFIMEVLRLHPSIMITLREPRQDTVIDGTVVPKGTPILISPYFINRSKRFWGADSKVFRPERWIESPQSGGASHSLGFFTFLSGSRTCIGKEYAIRSMKAVLIALIRDFSFDEAVKGFEPAIRKDLLAFPAGGMKLKVELLR